MLRADLDRLPAELLPFALAWLHRRAGAPYPAAGAARAELLRQIGDHGGGGLRLRRRLALGGLGAGSWRCGGPARPGSGFRISLILSRFRESWKSRRSP